MIAETPAPVTLGADVGGKDADKVVGGYHLALRRALAEHCRGGYSPVLKKFALVLRIDGSVQSWRKRGVDHVRIQKKSGYATADIFMPADIWKDESADKIRAYLATEVEVAIRRIIESAQKVKVQIESGRLLDDLDAAVKAFLAR